LGFDYVFVQAKVFYDTNDTSFYRLRGALLKDYGLVILFNNPDSWESFESARILNKDDNTLGTTTYPAVYWKVYDQNIEYSWVRKTFERKFSHILSWDQANYTSNETTRNDNGDYMFRHLYDLNDLSKYNKIEW